MDISVIAKWLIIFGIALAVIGCALLFAGKIGIPFGKLPGDIQIQREKWGLFFPIVSCIVLSIVLTIIVNLLFWLFKK